MVIFQTTMDEPNSDHASALRFTARAVRDQAHCPYSGLRVGAAVEVRLKDGSLAIFGGCNVENASYGLTMCAERVAIGNAVAAGAVEVTQVVISTALAEPLPPCGGCRQVISEFAKASAEVVSVCDDGTERQWRLDELLPAAVGGDDLPSSARASGSGEARADG
jgi:cytidine deaminase